jgi:hypothetical protein
MPFVPYYELTNEQRRPMKARQRAHHDETLKAFAFCDTPDGSVAHYGCTICQCIATQRQTLRADGGIAAPAIAMSAL